MAVELTCAPGLWIRMCTAAAARISATERKRPIYARCMCTLLEAQRPSFLRSQARRRRRCCKASPYLLAEPVLHRIQRDSLSERLWRCIRLARTAAARLAVLFGQLFSGVLRRCGFALPFRFCFCTARPSHVHAALVPSRAFTNGRLPTAFPPSFRILRAAPAPMMKIVPAAACRVASIHDEDLPNAAPVVSQAAPVVSPTSPRRAHFTPRPRAA